MSWWDIGNGDVIGDRPADIVTLALRSVADERADVGRARLDLASLLSALGRSLPGDDQTLRARLADGREVSPAAGREAEDAAIALREAFEEIDRRYGERWGRPANARELLQTVLFVLMGGAAEFLADGDSLQEIEEAQ